MKWLQEGKEANVPEQALPPLGAVRRLCRQVDLGELKK